MINFRFHLVSLVAVFLALGVGVAMGASFVDRATVETLRARLDQLEDNYRERGDEIDALRVQLRETDERTAALFENDSALIGGRLSDRNVVVIAPDELDPESVDAAWQVLEAAGARRAGTLELEPALQLTDEAVLAEVRELLELESASPSLVRGRLISRLANSLSLLTATAPDQPAAPNGAVTPDGDGAEPGDPPEGDPAGPDPADPAEPDALAPESRPLGPDPTAAELAEAQAFLAALADTGVATVTGSPGGAADFGGVDEVSFVILVADGTSEAAVSTVHRLSRELAEAAPATVTVAETSGPRQPGELPLVDGDRVGAMVMGLRNDEETVERLSTVDHLDELVGRIALVLAVEEQLTGSVGHYGTGFGARALVPTVDAQ